MTDSPDTAPDSPPRDYKATVFLPKTGFPMKAGLPQKEPAILAKWQADDLYRQLRRARAGRPKFIFHDGPPYANGDMHIGHALNHILKDMVCRTQNLLGKDAPYVPGWDCHGLPIEWKVEEQYRKKKLNKDDVDPVEFRAECRAYAQHWVDVQREQLKRLGINADWDNPYLTMDSAAEATIVAELMKFAESGQLYRGAKPVMWSPVEKTALAEAEIEYEDITSTQIDVAFEIVESPIAELVGAYAVVWTTTPWTIPVNQAIAYGPDIDYTLVELNGFSQYLDVAEATFAALNDHKSLPPFLLNRRFVVASDLVETFRSRIERLHDSVVLGLDLRRQVKVTAEAVKRLSGSELAGTIARHPMAKLFESPLPVGEGLGVGVPASANAEHPHSTLPLKGEGLNRHSPLAEFFLRPRPFLPGDFVTTDTGTGLVHMAPDHGEDDFILCKAHGIDPVFAVMGDGKFREDWAWLGGQGSVINAKFNAPDGPICSDLRVAGGLLAASADYKHSYPHSWRSKAKVIYRCTPQWFVPMDRPLAGDSTLRQTALAAIAATRWVPEKGRNRITAMVEGRPDWVLSRQRAWGVPITLFVERKSGAYLCDPAVNARIIAAVRAGGVDAWSTDRAQEYLGSEYDLADYERITDILDVWFDSGCTHAFVLESGKWPDVMRPADHVGPWADLYLEGTDQHRGWFQSSLLESCATRGHAPYKAVLTHGFTMDQKGMKMSKSLGNTINPLDLMRDYGADILRLWALSVDFTEDHRIGKEILSGVSDQYRKLRNTLRYLLGALDGFDEAERVAVADMPELERYVLHLLADMDGKLDQAVKDFDFNSYVKLITEFANNDLSAFFFDIRKDCLYCDAPTDPKRMAYRTVLDTLFHALVRYAAPVLVFTAEEVWGTRYPDAGSVHLLEWPDILTLRHSREGGNPSPDISANTTGQEMGPGLRRGDELVERWDQIRWVRAYVNEEIEPLRRSKIIGSSLQAWVELVLEPPRHSLNDVDWSEVLISAGVELSLIDVTSNTTVWAPGVKTYKVREGARVSVSPTTHHKCGRCWRHLPEVAEDGALCARCDRVLNA